MADQNERELEDEKQQFAVDVKHFVTTLMARQKTFEKKARKKQADFEVEIRGKLDALDLVVKTALADSLKTIEELIEKRMGRRPPDASAASSN